MKKKQCLEIERWVGGLKRARKGVALWISLLSANWNILISIFLFFFYFFFNDVDLKPWSPSMKIYKISRWNKVHSRNRIYNFISSIKCRHHMWIQIIKLDQHLLNHLNRTPIFFFQRVCKKTFDSLLKAMTPTKILMMSIGKGCPCYEPWFHG